VSPGRVGDLNDPGIEFSTEPAVNVRRHAPPEIGLSRCPSGQRTVFGVPNGKELGVMDCFVQRGLVAALAGVALLMGTTESRAGYAASLVGGAPTAAGGGLWEYDYSVSVTLNSGEVVNPGDFFRIYDFNGYVSAGTVAKPLPANWAVSSTNTVDSVNNQVIPPNVILQKGDDPGIKNITFSYSGAAITAGGNLGTFAIISTIGPTTTLKDFVGQTTNTTTSAPTPIGTILQIGVPVPEPTSLISVGIGAILFGIGFGRRARRSPMA
jgi:hypothetical protein